MQKGKLIVIEGTDGSGKTVQAHLLVEYLQKKGKQVNYFDFPQYETFFGQMVGQFLRGDFGQMDTISPYLSSLLYALDRKEVKKELDKILNNGGYIITNRYVTSNLAHQAARCTKEERKKFIPWIEKLEYEINGLPKEDRVIYLHVPPEISMKLASQKQDKNYLKGKRDIAETDKNHQTSTEKMYLELTKRKNWQKIECTDNAILLSPSIIHSQILTRLEFIDKK